MTLPPILSATALPLGRSVLALVLAMAFMPGPGCALLSRGSSIEPRWFTPERVNALPGNPERQGSEAGCELRLGRVTSGADLGLHIAHGDGLYQVGYYEGLRWTQRPEQYVRRALGRALFEEGDLRRALTGTAPTLDVEVVEFEEVKSPTTHAARVSLRVVLSNDRVILERTVVVSTPVIGDPFDGFVAAMAQTLEAAAGKIAHDVREARSESDDSCPAP